MKGILKKAAIAIALFLPVGMPPKAQTVPQTHANALDGSAVSFPPSGSPLLLVISFSHKAGDQLEDWDKRLKADYLKDPRVAYYQLSDFQGVPSFIMHLILHGMRRSVPQDEHGHFVPLYENEEAWKKAVSYSTADDAYVVVADTSGHVLWQTHGSPTDAKYTDLQAAMKKAMSGAH